LYHSGNYEGRILGDDGFSEKVLILAEEKLKNKYTLQQLIDAVCLAYGIKLEELYETGKKQPNARARAVTAYLVQEEESMSLTVLGNILNRDISALSKAAGRVREEVAGSTKLSDKLQLIRNDLMKMSKCQA
jgi:chromosomal replication initiation ATPase DnaA